jgi:hypothetical protein
MTREQMMKNLVEAWERIRPEVIETAWDIHWTKEGGDDGPGDTDDPTDGDYVPPEDTDLRRTSSDLPVPVRTPGHSHHRRTDPATL